MLVAVLLWCKLVSYPPSLSPSPPHATLGVKKECVYLLVGALWKCRESASCDCVFALWNCRECVCEREGV